MRVLVVSNIEWDDRNAFGNTVSNLFSKWPDTEFLSIYGRSALPNNNVCKRYYSISVGSIVKHLFCWRKIGRYLDLQIVGRDASTNNNTEKRLIKVGKRHTALVRLMRNLSAILYSTRIWQNDNYKQLISSFSPDVCFTFARVDSFIIENVRYVKSHTSARIVEYIVDDVYSQYNRIEKKKFRGLINFADSLYGISSPLNEEYSALFNIDIKLLQKGCVFSPIRKRDGSANKILTFLYAGNLYYGRENTLLLLASAIQGLPSQVARLVIYTATDLSDYKKKQFEQTGVVSINPPRPYNEIMQLMKDSDVVLHVESFDSTHVSKTRLSFSTKITDCFQSGRPIFAIGPESLASIQYLKSVDGVFCATTCDDVPKVLDEIISHSDKLDDVAIIIRTFASAHHDLITMQKSLQRDFYNMLDS